MTDKQPDALICAHKLRDMSAKFKTPSHDRGVCNEAIDLLRTQHAEIERLNSCLKWEQNRAERIGTHGPGCEKWGSAHYECALRAIERKDALLRQAFEHMQLHPVVGGVSLAESIKQELSQ